MKFYVDDLGAISPEIRALADGLTGETPGVIYARYSSHNQTEQSIEGQVRVCVEYARANGIRIVAIYADRAIPGHTDARPYFQQMIEDSALGEFKVVVMYNAERFARGRYLAAIYKHKLQQNSVGIKYAAYSIPEGPEGIIMEGLMESMAEYYSAELSVKIRRGMRESAAKCHATGSKPGLGYQVAPDKSYIIEETGSKAVQLIFDLYIKGKGKAEIVKTLNDLGYKSSTGRPFQVSSIDRIINNERYLGIYIYKDIKTPGGMPQIISQETWDLAKKEQERRRHAKPKYEKRADFLLSGKVFCGHCKSMMTGISGTSRSGKKHHYYACPEARKKKCKKRAVNKDFIEDLVVAETVNYVLTPEMIHEIAVKVSAAQETQKNDTAINYYKGRLASTRQAITNLMQALETGVGTKTLPARIKELEDEEENIKLEIEAIKRSTIKLSVEHIEYLLETYKDPGDDFEAYKRKIIDTFVSEIYLYDDKLVIFYNISENDALRSKELSLIESGNSEQLGQVFDNDVVGSTIQCAGRTPGDKVFVFSASFALMIKTPTSF